jgi:hypothetical protein
MYRFKGLYEVDVETSREAFTITYRWKARRVRTYAPIKEFARYDKTAIEEST